MRPSTWLRTAGAATALVAALALPAGAAAQDTLVTVPESADHRPAGFSLAAREARAIAERQDAVAVARRDQPGLTGAVLIPLYFGDKRYEVAYRAGGRGPVLVDVHVDGRTGRVLEVWTGPQADNLLARSYEPSIGRSLNEPWIWIPLAVLFLAPFVDPRRPFRLLHLDLLMLLGFGLSQLFYNRGDIEISVPLVYPLLAYLLVRMLAAGFRPPRGRGGGRPVPTVPALWLAVGLVALVAFRVGLNAVDSHVIDIGQASVFGADQIQHREDVYASGGDFGDTYGPLMYLAYVPFEAVFPADGPGGFDHAARAAAITFDLLVIVGLLLLGRRLRPGRDGRVLGLALAYAWAAYPFSVYALQANTNDALIAALVIWALVAMSSPPLRGVLLAVAAAAKFAPLALAPLFAAGEGGSARRPRELVAFGAALAAVVAVSAFVYLPDGGWREMYDATIGHQLGRSSPFSIWGLHPSTEWLQDAVRLGAAALALLVFFLPRRRDLAQVTALAAAVTIAVQLTATHWFYFYVIWFAPLVMAVAIAAHLPSRRRA